MSELINTIKDYLSEDLDVDTDELEIDTLLFSQGIIDSFSLVSLLTFIESTFGFRIGSGESLEEVMSTSSELAEGVRTLRITKHLAKHYRLRVPITEMLYGIVFEELPIQKAMDYLMTFPYDVDVDVL